MRPGSKLEAPKHNFDWKYRLAYSSKLYFFIIQNHAVAFCFSGGAGEINTKLSHTLPSLEHQAGIVSCLRAVSLTIDEPGELFERAKVSEFSPGSEVNSLLAPPKCELEAHAFGTTFYVKR